jgi:hypothetical protein
MFDVNLHGICFTFRAVSDIITSANRRPNCSADLWDSNASTNEQSIFSTGTSAGVILVKLAKLACGTGFVGVKSAFAGVIWRHG